MDALVGIFVSMSSLVAASTSLCRHPRTLDVAAKQIQGTRRRQEDHYLIAPLSGALLVAVADGMGGHPCGDNASRVAIEALRETVPPSLTKDLTPRGCSAALYAGLSAADVAVRFFGNENSQCQRLGTTLVAAMLLPEQDAWVFAATGDSHLYHIDACGALTHINAVHADSEGRLTSYIGASRLLVSGTGEIRRLCAGETLLLASDGLDTLTLAEIAVIVEGGRAARDTSQALAQAVTAINDPEQDNTTIVVVRIE
jgi:PPM family protein phosphatase